MKKIILFLILMHIQLYAQIVISNFPQGGDQIPKKVREKLDSLSNNSNKDVEIRIWGLADKKTWYPETQWPKGNLLKDSLIALARANKVADYLRSLGWRKVGISGLKTQTNHRGASLIIFKNEKSPKDTITITKKENYWNLSLGYQTLITERISLITPMIKLSFSHRNFSFSIQGGYSPWGRNHDLFFGPMIHLWSNKSINPIIGLGFGWELQDKTDFWEKKNISFLLGEESIIGKINLESGLVIGKTYNYKLKDNWDLGLFLSLGIRIGGE